MTYIATFGLYNSPFTRKPPEHRTYMSLNGMDWLLQTRNKALPIEELGYWQRHFANYLFGVKGYSGPLKRHGSPTPIPPHFNYNNEGLLGKTLAKDAYLVIDKRNELITTKIYPEYEYKWKFTPDDYRKLEYDESLDKIYDNGEMKIFYVDYAFISH